ncbi:T9SS type A sorting domain-containing protein [Taibaiella sp. KBW10]|uniref:T9SS type A sorting domain-containing protein n=1 Tax=Taibaiella sp. KBW10 TaxID=2153357 RepID=UPI001F3BB4F2|nr:T9SS type A sorting domain-containing protein [Taibaiella sp. KBW10]
MKKMLLFLHMLLIYIGAAITGFAQADFAPIGAKWYYQWNALNVGAEGRHYNGYVLQESVSDTLIHSVTARKLRRTAYSRNAQNNNIVSMPISSFFVYATADTVFYYNTDFNRFLPLYIFNVAAGDTMAHRVPAAYASGTDTIWKMVVDSIPTRMYNGQPLKVVYHHTGGPPFNSIGLRGPYGQYFGQLKGAFAEYEISYVPEAYYETYELRCYQDNTFDIHFGNASIACDSIPLLPLSLKDRSYLADRLSVYPNPAIDVLHISVSQIPIQSVEILDMLGRRVFLQTNKSVSDNMVLDVSGLDKSTYILHITTKDKGSVYKKVVLR